MASIEELLAEAAAATSPSVIGPSKVSPGGVDPLGLRQINFDLMDRVLPGLNNVAAKLRPFILMAWAWRRVRAVIDRDKLGGATDEVMRDFVDRIEAIYAWSQFLVDRNSEIPGGQALRELIVGDHPNYHFGGEEWVRRRDLRRTSTGLISPLNYGPGLRTMGWLIPAGPPGVFQSNPELDPALDAFEGEFTAALAHDAFNKLGEVIVDREDVERWGPLWALGAQTALEMAAGRERLFGAHANEERQAGFALVKDAADAIGAQTNKVDEVRKLMAGRSPKVSSNHQGTAEAWRRVQTRQLFRLALEGMFYWIIGILRDGPLHTDALAHAFLVETGDNDAGTAGDWLNANVDDNPVELINQLSEALRGSGQHSVPSAIKNALAFCLEESRHDQHAQWQFDRLPMKRALEEFERWKEFRPSGCLSKIIEVWIMAQHAYWCVGRGLADARGRGKTLLRLRVVMDDGGWTLTPATRLGNPPVATPDRLHTAASLLAETGDL
jgi:hypothetical protein